MQTYINQGTCSRQIIFDVTEDNRVTGVKFIGGCSGNLQGISRLVEGRPIDEVIATLSGIKCKGNTSCPDQLANALMSYKNVKKKCNLILFFSYTTKKKSKRNGNDCIIAVIFIYILLSFKDTRPIYTQSLK